MARPKKQTVDYFPHIATSGKTMFILETRFGNDGYAFWFKLLEILATSEAHIFDCRNSADWQFLLAKTRVDEVTANSLLDLLAELDAIDAELWKVKVIWCQNFVNNIADVYKNRKSKTPSKPEIDSFYEQKPEQRVVSTSSNEVIEDIKEVSTNENPQSKVKERKVKDSKSSSSTESVPVTEEKIKKDNDEDEINKIISCIDFWQQNVKINESMFVIESLDHWRKDFGAEGDEIVILAIQLMLKQGASNYSYLEKILKEWIGQKLDSVEKVKAYLKQRAAAHKPKSYNRQKTVKEVPNWMNNQPETPKQPEQSAESPTDLEANAERLRAKMANLFGGDGRSN